MTPLEKAVTEAKNIKLRLDEMEKEAKELAIKRAELIKLMHSWGMSFREIGQEVGLSRQRIYQVLHGIRSGRDRPRKLV